MSESLFSDSPYLLVLSVLALIVSFYYPVLLERKMTARRLPKPLRIMVLANIAWNACSILGIIFFSGPMSPDATDLYIGRQVLFGLQALCWVRVGVAIYDMGELILYTRRTIFKTMSFPFVDSRFDSTMSYKGLCVCYGLLRVLCIGNHHFHDDKDSLIDAVSALFHLIDHTSFYFNVTVLTDNAAVMLKL